MLNGKESYFLKPGKESIRTNPNINDMLPSVGTKDSGEFDGYTFEMIWEYLVKISIINQVGFKKLVLIYWLCYFIDHQKVGGKIRYSPSTNVSDYIEKIDFVLKDGFSDKFKKEDVGLFEFLHFINLLGWNEDVKYHTNKDGVPDFNDIRKRKVERPNTVTSIISVPLMINNFLSNIIEKVNYVERINVRLILSTMQKLRKSRGVCIKSQKKFNNI